MAPAMGFGLINFAAAAVAAHIAEQPDSTVAILDWDVHHGNGTQKLLYEEGRCLYISLHRYAPGFYPESGALEEVGDDHAQSARRAERATAAVVQA